MKTYEKERRSQKRFKFQLTWAKSSVGAVRRAEMFDRSLYVWGFKS